MLEVTNLHYRYPGSETPFALKGFSFRLAPGERVALMGANGSGKTTFIRCLNGLILPTAGDVTVDGLSTRNPAHLYEIRRSVGMVFQYPDQQIVTTTVTREIAFGLENLGLERGEMIRRVEEALDRFHLRPYRDDSPHLLSGGERQRLTLASIWVMEPRYMVLDEPTSLLDPQGRVEIFEHLEHLRKFGLGIVFVTQFADEAMSFDRLIVMDAGMIVADGSPAEVFRNVEWLRQLGLDVPVEYILAEFTKDLR